MNEGNGKKMDVKPSIPDVIQLLRAGEKLLFC